MARLIDADALFKEFERAAWYNNADRDEIAEEILWQMPTIDAVPVVRCKDCRNYAADCYCKVHDNYVMYDNDFCSYGKRKEVIK